MMQKLLRNFFPIIAGVIIVFLLCEFGNQLFLNMNRDKPYVPEIEQQARTSQNIPDTWDAVSETTDSVAAVLLYDSISMEHILLVYTDELDQNENHGFSLIAGGAIPVKKTDIVELCYNDKYIYASLNRQSACLLQIRTESGFSTIQIDPDHPFIIISPIQGDEATFFDVNDNVIAFDMLSL